MTATWVMEAFCVAGVLFMVRFLVALVREARVKTPCCVVYLSSQHAPSQDDALNPVTEMGIRSERDDSYRRVRFEVIAGGAEPPSAGLDKDWLRPSAGWNEWAIPAKVALLKILCGTVNIAVF